MAITAKSLRCTMSPPALHLIVQLYGREESASHKRMMECICRNAELEFIKKITVASEDSYALQDNGKIEILHFTKRCSYADLLEIAASNAGKQETTHFAISNTDIYLTDDILACMRKITLNSQVAAISRTETSGELFQPAKWSQDLWLFKSHIPNPKVAQLSWQLLGVAGCEHLFAMSLYSQGYDIWNPCLDCKIIHNDPKPKTEWHDRYYGSYLYLLPCTIGDVSSNPPQYEVVVARDIFREAEIRSIPTTEDATSVKLHLCCGEKRIPGFLGVDIRESINPDIVGSAENLWMIEDGAVQEIYFCHGLEHIPLAKAKNCLGELNRVLKENGVLRLALPDFEALTRLYIEGQARIDDIVLAIHGGQDHAHNLHYSSWDLKSLSKALQECGFANIRRYDARSFLPTNYFDWSLHSLYGIETSLNIECIKIQAIS